MRAVPDRQADPGGRPGELGRRLHVLLLHPGGDIEELPTTFNITNATKHLSLFNVKHFIARWERTKAALAASPDWKALGSCREWDLYELIANDGHYVFIPPRYPVGVRLPLRNPAGSRTERWKEDGMQWIYTIGCLDQPFVYLLGGEAAEPIQDCISESEYLDALRETREGMPRTLSRETHGTPAMIRDEVVTDNSIRFKTSAVGLPHIVKCTYYPNWKVRGARQVFMVSPCFMLVYPDQAEVELYYGQTAADNTGLALSIVGLCLAACGSWFAWRRART